MSVNVSTKILNKINKLLALSESPNEHEASSAMLKAQELLVKYNLSIENIKSKEEESVVGGSVQADYTESQWKLSLANVIAENFKCYAIGRQFTRTIVFLGEPTDVSVATTVYRFAYTCIESTLLSYSSVEHTDYATGFVEGLRLKFETQRKQNKWEVVLYKSGKVEEEYARILGTTTNHSLYDAKPILTSQTYLQGVQDGKSFAPYTKKEVDKDIDASKLNTFCSLLTTIIETLTSINWMACFRMYPSYQQARQRLFSTYNELESLSLNLKTLYTTLNEAESACFDDVEMLLTTLTETINAFILAYNEPQSNLRLKRQHEDSYRNGIAYLVRYKETYCNFMV